MEKLGVCRAALAVAVLLALPPAVAAEQPPATDEKPPVKIDMSKGGITFSSGDSSLTLNAKVQFRYTLADKEEFDADTVGTGDGLEDGWSGDFSIPRARLALSGTAFKPWLKYQFEFEFSGTKGVDANKIKDAALEFVPTPLAAIKAGQYKVPFSLQELTSDFKQEFVDRSITNAKFAPARDMGVSVSGTTEKKVFGYAVGIFNGAGESKLQDDKAYLYVARVWFDPLGEYKLYEGALEDVKEPILHFGLGARSGEAIRGNLVAGVFENPDNQTAYNVEFAYRQAFFFTTAEYFMDSTEQSNPTPGPDIDSDGYHAQIGFMVIPKRFEIALRYAAIDPDNDLDDDDLTEARIGFSYFWKDTNLKFQADYGQVTFGSNFSGLPAIISPIFSSLYGSRLTTGEELTDNVLRAQIQLAF